MRCFETRNYKRITKKFQITEGEEEMYYVIQIPIMQLD